MLSDRLCTLCHTPILPNHSSPQPTSPERSLVNKKSNTRYKILFLMLYLHQIFRELVLACMGSGLTSFLIMGYKQT
jgi:hypothetical protein